METELWPNLLRTCRSQSIPVALVNGRISATSFRRYRMIKMFTARMLNNLTMAIMQSERDVIRIRELGMASERVSSAGNLKFDGASNTGDDEALNPDIRNRFDFRERESLIVAASTHWPEEQVLIEAFKRIKQITEDRKVRLLIAPRHPERFNEVADLIADSGLSWARRTNSPAKADATCRIILLDSIGELRTVFPLADIAFIGAALPHTADITCWSLRSKAFVSSPGRTPIILLRSFKPCLAKAPWSNLVKCRFRKPQSSWRPPSRNSWKMSLAGEKLAKKPWLFVIPIGEPRSERCKFSLSCCHRAHP
jgi:hypothetical protein